MKKRKTRVICFTSHSFCVSSSSSIHSSYSYFFFCSLFHSLYRIGFGFGIILFSIGFFVLVVLVVDTIFFLNYILKVEYWSGNNCHNQYDKAPVVSYWILVIYALLLEILLIWQVWISNLFRWTNLKTTRTNFYVRTYSWCMS